MVLVKTEKGQQALQDRRGALSPRQRSAFILFDGKRSTEQVLAATAAMGITGDDVQSMLDLGLLEFLEADAGAAAAPAVDGDAALLPTDGWSAPPAGERPARCAQERYQNAYPIATELTAAMGLRGFRLNLAIEGVGSFEELAALAPRIRAAVGDAKYARLHQALFD